MLHILAMITPLVWGEDTALQTSTHRHQVKLYTYFVTETKDGTINISFCPSSMQEHNANPLHPHATTQYSDTALILLH